MAKVKGTGEIVPTAADYDLKNCDETLRAFAFIHACGKWEEFVDKVYSQNPSLLLAQDSQNQVLSEDSIDQQSLDDYDYQSRERLAALSFGNHVTNVLSKEKQMRPKGLNNPHYLANIRDKYNDLFKL